jgi:2-hydroxycyclohexanecarboxyl-CoA dehydrogenase
MNLDLKGESVVVTGGASHIGRAIALQFAEEGANITIGDIDAEHAATVAELCAKKGASGAQSMKTNVIEFDEVQAMFRAAVDRFGTVDVLVNNVGWDDLMLFTQTTPQLWRKIIDINYLSVLNCTHAALDIMIPKKSGAIVSIGSDASRQGEPREAVYGGVKAAVSSFMKTIAKENGRFGIRCNTVCPGATVPQTADEVGGSSLWSNPDAIFTPQQLEKVAHSMPLRKLGRAQDIANAVVFLASKAAGHITGQVLSVSGGYSMVG